MIKHVVCFKLKNREDVDKAKEVLLSMKGNVPQIIDMEVGVDFLHSERSYDLMLTVILKDKVDLKNYQNDPYHCSVVKTYMHSVREGSIAVDYEI